MDSWKNRSKSEESMKISTLALFDALFHFKMGHKLCEASIEYFDDVINRPFLRFTV